MTPTYHFLFFATVSILCTVYAQSGNAKFNESLDCNCGRKGGHSFRIVGGKEAEANAYPWMAAIYSKYHGKLFCGSALISNRYVVTAGHCVKWLPPDALAIILGLHDQSMIGEEEKGIVSYDVENVILHPEFRSASFYDVEDIALLKLKKPVEFTKTIRPVCLPKNSEEDYSNKVALVTGWGRVRFKVGQASRFLKETSLNVLSNADCKKNPIIGDKILDSMICAYQDETDACQGDSGGPLTYETISEKTELIGVVSWGIDCAKPNVPGIYTRVTTKLDWIAENTKDSAYCRNL